MVDTLKKARDDDKGDPVENKPPETQSKYWRPKRCSKSHRRNKVIGENSTPDDAENNEDPVGARSEQEEQENEQANPDEQALPSNNLEDDNYLPLSEDEVSLGDEDFIVPEEPLEQECFKHKLIATARSLKKKQQQLQADQDLLNDRWTQVLVA